MDTIRRVTFVTSALVFAAARTRGLARRLDEDTGGLSRARDTIAPCPWSWVTMPAGMSASSNPG
ncbi:MAG TPA: hypothetical protein VGS19_04360 [Streptosporangiaceae bacterium]|nr:hypothetical protein [Streptosporangiaceae bacterium]